MKITARGESPLTPRLDFACNLARRVGREALQFWEENGSDKLEVANKGLQDFVTKADKAAERTIREALLLEFPLDGFVGEESGGQTGTAGYWVVDPIDGTSNYLRGLRHWGVSIAYVENNQTVLGVVHDSPSDRIYAAQLHHGAKRDGQTIKVSTTANPHAAMGILGASRRTAFKHYLSRLRALHDAGIEHRKIGSAALGIVRVAEGVADFYYEEHLNCWDALAALLIAKEAGARNRVPPMRSFMNVGGEVFCAAPNLSAQLEGLLLTN